MADQVRLAAPAKVNLRLHILGRETSGFHSLETIFCAVSLQDEIRVQPGGAGIVLSVSPADAPVGPPAQNLVVRAAERFYRELGEPGAIRIELTKRIPAAAGLGGGSSDAAATFRALNALHGEPFAVPVLLQLGTELGSDVPFFLCGSPLALAWGRGQRLLTLPALPRRPVLIAHPGVAMPTAEAFARIAELRGAAHDAPASSLAWESMGSWDEMARLAGNDFEPVAWERIPYLAGAKRAMMDEGADIALLSGSGASLFGVFPAEDGRDAAAARLRAAGFSCWVAETLGAVPEPQVDPGVAEG